MAKHRLRVGDIVRQASHPRWTGRIEALRDVPATAHHRGYEVATVRLTLDHCGRPAAGKPATQDRPVTLLELVERPRGGAQ